MAVTLPSLRPMLLTLISEPFDHPDWVFEIKHDGFRALAFVQNRACQLISRRGHVFKRFPDLAAALAEELRVRDAILDGEIVCPDAQGKSVFKRLLSSKAHPFFFAFDLLWLNGKDLRDLPLVTRKERLAKLMPEQPSRVLYVEHLVGNGTGLFRAVCEEDLEGIVSKRQQGRYVTQSRAKDWLKIKNPDYSQAEGRGELFEGQKRRSR